MARHAFGGNTHLMRETRERSVPHNATSAGTSRALQVRAKETVLLGLIARRSGAICTANSSTLKTCDAMTEVTGDARGDRRGGAVRLVYEEHPYHFLLSVLTDSGRAGVHPTERVHCKRAHGGLIRNDCMQVQSTRLLCQCADITPDTPHSHPHCP